MDTETWICRKNIERLRELIAAEGNDEQKAMARKLLEEERTKLAELLQRNAEPE